MLTRAAGGALSLRRHRADHDARRQGCPQRSGLQAKERDAGVIDHADVGSGLHPFRDLPAPTG
ncbi:hypothetical protein [Streptosporangium canum]|uniref:hypothetical protein n=1 Tax=Streptosporangium canum TaxID=324952 RepID=UPI0037B67AA8